MNFSKTNILFVGIAILAAVLIFFKPIDLPIGATLEPHLQLKAEKHKVVHNELKDGYVEYAYITDKVLTDDRYFAPGRKYSDGKYIQRGGPGETTTIEFDGHKVFKDIDGTVYDIQLATTTQEAFTEQTKLGFVESIIQTAWATEEVFTTSGTWTVPAGVTSVDVEAWGGAGNGSTRTGWGGGGGGGGAYAATTGIGVTPAAEISYVVGGIATNSTWDSTVVVADAGNTGSSEVGGLGGTVAASTGTTRFKGGDGGNGINIGDPSGGGGGSAGPDGAGNDGADGDFDGGGVGGSGDAGSGGAGGSSPSGTGGSSTEGGGGAGGADNAGTGGIGGVPSGGGGGGEAAAGSGKGGKIRINYTAGAADTTIYQDIIWFY
jgi:hypothetical protein